jgi:hypothetical protein
MLVEPLPSYLIKATAMKRLSNYSEEKKQIFGLLSRHFSNEPGQIFQMLINNPTSPYYKQEISAAIFAKSNIPRFTEYPVLDEYQAFTDTIDVGDYILYNGDISNNQLKNSLEQFFAPKPELQPYVFVGFIQSKPLFLRQALKKITKVDGHMGCFIINSKTRQVIYFEPKGAFITLSVWKRLKLKGVLQQLLPNNEFDSYDFVDTSEFSLTPKTPQYFDIYCQTFSLYAVLFYCLNLFNDVKKRDGKIDSSYFSGMTQEKAIVFQNFFCDFIAPIIKLEFRKSDKPSVSRTFIDDLKGIFKKE